jgi:hypothetical protein
MGVSYRRGAHCCALRLGSGTRSSFRPACQIHATVDANCLHRFCWVGRQKQVSNQHHMMAASQNQLSVSIPLLAVRQMLVAGQS